MSEQQQPKEYITTEENICEGCGMCKRDGYQNECCIIARLRSRPHLAPDNIWKADPTKGCDPCKNTECEHCAMKSENIIEHDAAIERKAREKFVSVIRELRNALIVSANNAHERKAIVNEVKPERMFYNEMQFQSLVEFALEKSNGFKPEYEDSEPLIWKRESLRHHSEQQEQPR